MDIHLHGKAAGIEVAEIVRRNWNDGVIAADATGCVHKPVVVLEEVLPHPVLLKSDQDGSDVPHCQFRRAQAWKAMQARAGYCTGGSFRLR